MQIKTIKLFILCSLFFLINLLQIKGGSNFSLFLIIFFLIGLMESKKIDFHYLLLLFLLIDIRTMLAIGAFTILYVLPKMIVESNSRGKNHFFIFLMLLCFTALMVETVFLEYNINYNIAKTITLLSPLCLLLLTHIKKPVCMPEKFHSDMVFYFVIVTYIVCHLLFFLKNRYSIFNGSENIGFAIISLLYAFSIANERKVSQFILKTVLLFTTVAIIESRYALFFSIFFIPMWFTNDKYFIRKLIFFYLLVLLVGLFGVDLIFNIQLLDRVIFFVDLFRSIENFNIYDLFLTIRAYNIRGELYMEGIDLFLKSPYFGYGSISPQALKDFGGVINDFHNSIISMLVSYGLFGSILYATSLLITLKVIKIDQKYIYVLIIYFFISTVQPIHLNIQFGILFALFLSYRNLEVK